MLERMRWVIATFCITFCLSFANVLLDNVAFAHDFGGNSAPEPEPQDEPDEPCKEDCCVCDGCFPQPEGDPGNSSDPGFTGGSVGDPVNLRRGVLQYQRVDLSVGNVFPIVIRRAYDSRTAYDSPLGRGWAFDHDRRLFEYPHGDIGIRTGCGRRSFFVEAGGGYVTPKDGIQGDLTQLPDGSFEFRYSDDHLDKFDADGRLIVSVNPKGHQHEFIYHPAGKLPLTGTSSYSVNPELPMVVAYMPRLTRIETRSADGQLTGDAVDFTYDSVTGRLTKIEASDGRELTYEHDETPEGLTLGNLLVVQGLDNLYHEYEYDDPDNANLITSIKEGLNTEPVINEYDDQGRVERQIHGDGILEFDYVDPLVRTRVTRKIYDEQAQLLHSAENTIWFDAAGYIEKEVNPHAHELRRFYDGSKNLIRTELWENTGGSFVNLKRGIDFDYDSKGRKISEEIRLDTNEFITRTWTYDHGWIASEQVVSSDNPGKIFRTEYTFVRDSQGRPVNIGSVKRRNSDGSFSTTTYDYCTPTEAAMPGSTCPYEGLLKSVDGPRAGINDVTTYAYHPDTDLSGCDTGGSCHRKGNLHTVTNALGHVIEFVRYDRAGRVVEIEDPNGVITELSYHPRGWLLSREVQNPDPHEDSALTSYTYSDVGNPTRITLPDGSFIDLTYDARNRLTEISDNQGNHIEYVLDSEGNRLAQRTYDPQDTLMQILTMEYDAVNQLEASLNAQDEKTTYSYDAAGNMTASVDPLAVETQEQYDGLNRLTRIIQDVGGIDAEMEFHYDAMGTITEVVDPKGLSTVYEYDARGNLQKLTSPDTGITSYSYDAADNRISQTDARRVTVEYTYDGLNRLTQIEYPDSSLDVSYHYDEGDGITGCADSYPIGRMTRMTDPFGETIYCYDHRGNITGKRQIAGTLPHTLEVVYEYDLADQLEAILYPSGQRVEMQRDSVGRLTQLALDGGPILVNDVEYLPFGPAKEYTLGSNDLLTKDHDQNYWTSSVTSQSLTLHFRHDSVGNIDRIGTAPGAATPIEQYNYDELYRLDTVEDGSSTLIEGYSYDATGNRLSKQTSSGTQSYSYPVDSHRLVSVASQSRSYDAVGNMISDADGSHSYTYDDRNRLVDFSSSTGSGQYKYNAHGQRVQKVASGPGFSANSHFIYDESGRLLGEYFLSPAGYVVQREYVYADDVPVAVLDGSSSTPYYVHTDHLGTPRAVTDQVGTKRWEWTFQSNPFGEQLPDEDPDSSGTDFTFNLRFPGQYFDAESGLHYNYFRDYEPHTGRYVQSDPIGISAPAGLATYLYAHASPLIFSDRLGLDPEDDPFGGLPRSPFPGIDYVCYVSGGCDDEQFKGDLVEGITCYAECVSAFGGGYAVGEGATLMAAIIEGPGGYWGGIARGVSIFGNVIGAASFMLCTQDCNQPPRCEY